MQVIERKTSLVTVVMIMIVSSKNLMNSICLPHISIHFTKILRS